MLVYVLVSSGVIWSVHFFSQKLKTLRNYKLTHILQHSNDVVILPIIFMHVLT